MKKYLTKKQQNPTEVWKNTKSYCPLLWCHLHVDTQGHVQPCCLSNDETGLGNINKESFDDIWNGDKMKDARQKLLRDQPIKYCNNCYEKEKSSNWSLRKDSIQKYHKHVTEWIENTQNDGTSLDSKPFYWDIRFSNICNMRCRMCNHASSSRWFQDALELSNKYNNHGFLDSDSRAIIKGVKDSAKLLDRLDEFLPYVKEIYFAGGEPMIMEEHYKIIKKLNQNNITKPLIRYNTNLSQLYYKKNSIIDLWKNFHNIQCTVSVDSYGKQAEIIRKDTDWTVIENNLYKIKQYAPHVKLEIAPTIQILNIFSVTELHRSLIEKELIEPNRFFLNILHQPDYYCIQNLPKNIKIKAKNNLLKHAEFLEENSFCNVSRVKDTIYNTIDFMMAADPDTDKLGELVQITKQLDDIRGENTFKNFPELIEIWKNY